MGAGSWYRLVGSATSVLHFATEHTAGAAGTYLGFACGRTFSVADVTSVPWARGRRCATCTNSLEASGLETVAI